MCERALPAKGSAAPGKGCPAVSQRRWFFRCSVLRIRDAVQWWCLPGPLKPSMAAVSLAIPGQTAPSRHHHCPAHFAAAPPRVRTPPGPFYEVWFVAANLPRSAGIGWARPGPCLARDGQTPSLQGCTRGVSWTGPPDPGAGFLERKVLGACRVAESHPFTARQAPTSGEPQAL